MTIIFGHNSTVYFRFSKILYVEGQFNDNHCQCHKCQTMNY